MKYSLQVIGSTTVESRASVAVIFDSQRYLFNCGEGTQRFLNDRSKTCSAVSAAKTRQIFLTRCSWDTLGGIPGLFLTLADQGAKGFDLWGPSGISHAMAAMRPFLFRPSLAVRVNEVVSTDICHQDENLTVRSVVLSKIAPSDTLNENGKRLRASFNAKVDGSLRRMFASFPNTVERNTSPASMHPLAENAPKSIVERLDPIQKTSTLAAYVCQGPKVNGKFDVAAAKKLGVPKGPLYGKLSRGESIVMPNGREVHPHECCAPSRNGAYFIILDCPSPQYIPSVTTSKSLQASTFEPDSVQCIVHLTADGVLENDAYKEWMRSFGPNTHHIICDEEFNAAEVSLTATAQIQHDLNLASSECFPLPFWDDTPRKIVNNVSDMPNKVTPAQPLLSFQFEPKPLLDTSSVLPPFESIRAKTEDSVFEEYRVQAENARNSFSFGDPGRPLDENDMLVIPLGTAAAIPGKYRNVSSTYLRFTDMSILLDAGEGTLGQLYRHFGRDKVDDELKLLRCIFVSHLHADHHLGVFNILSRIHKLRMNSGLQDRLCLIGPKAYINWIQEYSDVEEFGIENLVLIDSKRFLSGSALAVKNPPLNQQSEELASFHQVSKLSSFQTVLVKHCPSAYALVFEHQKSEIKVAFSGDCRPSQEFVRVGTSSDLLIHEATLEDSKMEEALEKKHSTTGEALEIATGMKAKNVLLTHFSQRYPKLPVLDMDKIRNTSKTTGHSFHVGIAFDSMRVRLSEFGNLEHLYSPLNILWGQTNDEKIESEVVENGQDI